MKKTTVFFSCCGKSLLLFCCLALLAGCVTTRVKKLEQEQKVQVLSPEAVLQLVEGNTLFLHSFGEDTYLYFDPSSRLYGKDIFNNKDMGRWDVSEEGELCLRMNSWWYGDLRCFQVLTDGKKYKLASSGVVQFTASQYPGDSKNLFYAIKKKKRSYRHSARARQNKPVARVQQSADTAASATDAVPPKRSIVEEHSPSAELAEKNIRSTLKWMARDCPGCNLAGTDLKKADLVAAELNNANLQGAVLRMANLRRANLAGANLEGADLSRANMPGANLRGANLKNASLKGANLIRADLTGAKIDGADFTDALLESVQGLPASVAK